MTHAPVEFEREFPTDTEIMRRIRSRFDVGRIVVFGSRARGDHETDSDLDLFVEMRSDLPPRARRLAIRRIFATRAWPLDVVVYTPEEVQGLRRRRGTLLSEIEREGRVLYARR